MKQFFSVYRSERMETRLQEIEQNTLYEIKQGILEKVQTHFEKEELSKKKKNSSLKINISQLKDPSDLYDLIENYPDPESIGVKYL